MKKLSNIEIAVDMSDTCKKLKYNRGKAFQIPPTPILPCRIKTGTVNGKETEFVIKFLGDSPLMEIAKLKKQILNIALDAFDIDGRNTRAVLSAKHYTVWRIFETDGDKHHKLTPAITFEDIAEKCIERDKRQSEDLRDLRKAVDFAMSKLKTSNRIKAYEFIKQNQKFYSVKWTPL